MKKLLFLLSIPLFLSANIVQTRLKLLDTLVNLLSDKNEKIYIQDLQYIKIKSTKHGLNIVQNCENAKFLLITSSKHISDTCFTKNQIIIVTNYKAYMQDTNVLGAVFWQKGRLNIIFRKNRLEDLAIKLPQKYHIYIE